MNKELESGLYFIDDDYKILCFNEPLKKMYPNISEGQFCYKAFAEKDSPCSQCPLNSEGKYISFYNAAHHEWIHAQAARANLPVLGECRSVMLNRTTEMGSFSEDDQAMHLKKAAMELGEQSERTAMIGGYCEDGFPLFFADDKMVRMLGYDDYEDFKKGIKGLVANTIHPDDMAQVAADIGPEYYVGLEYQTIYRMPRKDGTWFWTIDKGKVIEAEDGRLAIVSYCTDITSSLIRQQELEKQNEVLQQQYDLMEFINSGMPGGYHRCSTDEGFPFLYVSGKFLEILGFTRDELRKEFDDKYINLVHPDDRVILNTACCKPTDEFSDQDISLHYRMLTKSGEYIHIVDNSRHFEYDGKEFFQGIIIDISLEESEHEHIESLRIVQNALQDALLREQRYRQQLDNMQHEILDSITCGVVAYTIPDHELLIINDAAKKMIGCHESDDPMQALKTFLTEKAVPTNNIGSVSDHVNALRNNGDSLIQDYTAVIDGSPINVHANIKRLENSGGEPYILVTLLNTTDQTTLTKNLLKERKAYRDALSNGSEYNFLIDVTDGMIREEFVTAHNVNFIKMMGHSVPVRFDDILEEYIERFQIRFASEEMKKNFTCKGLIDDYNNGITNVISEYYNPGSDMFFRVSSLLSIDDETGHVQASVVADNVTEIRKKERMQQEALKSAYDEMNVRINAILDGISGGLKIIDIEKGYRYEYISEGAAQLQGYTVSEFMDKFGSRVTSNIYGDEGEPALAEANRQIAENGSYSVKYRVAHKDGTIKWVIDRGKYVEDTVTGRKYFYILMQDVTDLETRNARINDVLMMQKQMADSLGSGIFAYTIPEYEVLILNQEARAMFDLMGSDEKNCGMDIVSRIIPEDLPIMRENVRKLKAPGDHAEYIFHTDSEKNGRLTFKCHTKLLSFENEQRYIISSITDITEQELTELRLDEERRQYRNALAYSSDSIFTIDLTDGYIHERLYSKDGKDLLAPIGINVPAFYDDLADIWFSNNRIVSDSDEIDTVKCRDKLIEYYRSGRSMIDLEYHIPDSGQYYRVFILLYKFNDHIKANFIITDVTANRHEEKQKLSVIESLGHIYMALYHISLTDDLCTIFKANDDIITMLPKQSNVSTFLDIYFRDFVEEEYLDDVKAFLNFDNIRNELMDNEFTSIEFKRKYLGWCRVTIVAADRDENGVVTSVVFAGSIIEKQKQAELAQQEALRAACESANIANSAKTDFLANMSHDIRTPMNAIIGMTAIAGTHIDDKERVADCLQKISISSKHLLGLINEVLDMSKIESGKMELQEEEFNLPELIDNLLNISKTEVEAKKHELTVSIRGIEHENVIGDSQRIQQVFMNLMSNAIKYTPAGGRISLYINEKSTNKQQIGCYEFVFEDNGIGMDEKFQEHLFEPFTRATSDPRVDKIQGTGLGLPITRNIIQMMNGDIKVESKLNEGTRITVTIFLLLQNSDDNNSSERFVDLPILVADDDEDSCIYTCELLNELGMKGEWVITGAEAVEKTAARHEKGEDYFAVILDWKMPGMDGVETTREIRRCIGKDVPIIIISAYDWSDIELEARAAGANAFISKPLFKSRMLHLFNELTGNDPDSKAVSSLDVLAQESFSGKRALLVEDNPLNAEIASEILSMADLEVELAVNGKEAVDMVSDADEGYYDIIFMDIQMPVMNGYEAARAIRALPGDHTKFVPIIAMTANAFAEDVAAAKNAGMNEHIAKPLDFSQLSKALKKWLM